MTAVELIDRIREAGGKLRLRDGRRYAKGIPEHLAGELNELKPEIVRKCQRKHTVDRLNPQPSVGQGGLLRLARG